MQLALESVMLDAVGGILLGGDGTIHFLVLEPIVERQAAGHDAQEAQEVVGIVVAWLLRL